MLSVEDATLADRVDVSKIFSIRGLATDSFKVNFKMKIPLILPKFVQGIGSMQQKQIGIKLLFLFKANKSTPNKPVHETNRQLQLETFSWQLK